MSHYEAFGGIKMIRNYEDYYIIVVHMLKDLGCKKYFISFLIFYLRL